MFEISEGDLPIVQTRKALLVLDIQNDFVASDGILPVDEPVDYVEKIIDLVPSFRSSGCIIWVRSQFETYRPVNDGTSTGDRVITDNDLKPALLPESGEPGRRRGIPSKTLLKMYDTMLASQEDDDPDAAEAIEEPQEPYDNETYLSPEMGKKPQCALPQSSGANYAQPILQAVDHTKDLLLTKTHYSAFKNGALLQILRGQFVTELFVCGALTNISVFATAMDAAQFGYSITLVEDCLGYRNKARHDEAIRQLVDTTGCEIVSSLEVVEAMNAKEGILSRFSNSKRPVRETRDGRDLDTMITNLKLSSDTSAATLPSHSIIEELPSSKDTSTSGTQATGSHDSLLPAPSASDDSLPERLLMPRKAEGETRKRVPNKIKARRRPSKGQSNNQEGQSSGHLQGGYVEIPKVIKAPVSPTQITLTSAAELLKKLPPHALPGEKSPNEVALSKEEDLITVPEARGEMQPFIAQETDVMLHDDKEVEAEESKDLQMHSCKADKNDDPAQKSLEKEEGGSFPICDGDSEIIHNLLSQSEASNIFEKVRDEVKWQKMSHQGGDVPRLVSVQGDIDEDGSIPIYRHPADESPPLLPFTPAVSLIRSEVERKLGHKVNHCLIQFYRNGTDYISEHSDKTLDIAPESFIANVSLGALRSMTFRTKKPIKDPQSLQNEEKMPRTSCKVPLPHNSMCKMSLHTNMKWLHGIRQDKRPVQEKTETELAFDVGRISLTFRLIGTFLDSGQTEIWGQGAVSKKKIDARTVLNGGSSQAEKMLMAFGEENHSSNFDWQEAYGQGFDVLHIQNHRKLFSSEDTIADSRVKIALSELELDWVVGELSPPFYWKQIEPQTEISEKLPVKFVDNDLSRAKVQGDLSILLYLDASYRAGQDTPSQVQKARRYTRLLEADAVLRAWRAKPFDVKPLRRLLALWDTYASENTFIDGPAPSIADCAFWPVLHEIVKEWDESIGGSPHLQAYYERMRDREAVQKVIVTESAVSKT